MDLVPLDQHNTTMSTYTTTGAEEVHVVHPTPEDINHQTRELHGLDKEYQILPRPAGPADAGNREYVQYLHSKLRRHQQIAMELDAVEMARRYCTRTSGDPDDCTDTDVANFLRMMEQQAAPFEDAQQPYNDELPTMAE